ncbi:hypothetical protein LF1_04680 [Rubripirellula obstinata]|uniref:Uncharacterized protein n=1 Tax=Rubripirellula obstinata TaxID=406547 RepID=A0A5B1CA30_9BACT|nr:hypothetical protein [Rubripirellula obstinata]KAA1257977.1 hypothetical protein LF1_04680 [Rubripirellula obstinata]
MTAEHKNPSRPSSPLNSSTVITDAGVALTLTCEVMNFNVNPNLKEVVSADVTLKPTQSASGDGMNGGGGGA